MNSKKREVGLDGGTFVFGEKQIISFAEKVLSTQLGSNSSTTQLRTTTILDPMTYMLFGAYHLRVTGHGLECDDWLPIIGDVDGLDDIQRLKTLVDDCMLRVFEGVGKALGRQRHEILRAMRNATIYQARTIADARTDEDDVKEHESDNSDDEAPDWRKNGEDPNDRTLSLTEVAELDHLTTDLVRILERYAEDRGVIASRPITRASSPAPPPAVSSIPTGPAAGTGIHAGGTGAYRPPIPRGPRGAGYGASASYASTPASSRPGSAMGRW